MQRVTNSDVQDLPGMWDKSIEIKTVPIYQDAWQLYHRVFRTTAHNTFLMARSLSLASPGKLSCLLPIYGLQTGHKNLLISA